MLESPCCIFTIWWSCIIYFQDSIHRHTLTTLQLKDLYKSFVKEITLCNKAELIVLVLQQTSKCFLNSNSSDISFIPIFHHAVDQCLRQIGPNWTECITISMKVFLKWTQEMRTSCWVYTSSKFACDILHKWQQKIWLPPFTGLEHWRGLRTVTVALAKTDNRPRQTSTYRTKCFH
jgi:hypothetical protein